MKKSLLILPIACSAPALFGCSTTSPELSLTPRVEPLQYIRHATQSAHSYYHLGRYYQGQNRLDKAEEAYIKALELHSNDIDTQNSLGTVYSRQGKYDQAISIFTAILKIKPDIAKVYNNLGYTYYLQSKHVEAITAFEKAILLEPNNPRTLNNLAYAHQLAGNEVLAENAFARARELQTLSNEFVVNGPVGSPENTTNNDVKALTSAPEKPIYVDLHPRISQSIRLEAQDRRIVTLDVFEDDQTQIFAQSTASTQKHPQNAIAIKNDHTSTPTSRIEVLPSGTYANTVNAVNEKSATMPPSVNTETISDTTRNSAPPKPSSDKNYITMSGYNRKMILPGKGYRLEVSNGNGITGMARRTSTLLAGKGVPHARLTNHKPYQQKKTVIYYRAGFQNQAMALNIKFGGHLQIVQASELRTNTDIKLLLGKDLTEHALAHYKGIMA